MKALTGCDLPTGEVIYRTADGGWSLNIADALLMDDAFAETALADAKKQETVVVGPYLIVMDGPGVPTHREAMRENIRARGPTVRLDLGKQAEDA